MYNSPLVLRVKSATPWAGTEGNSGNKQHGITLHALCTVTDPEEFFKDIGFGKGAKFINPLLNGELPAHAPFSLQFSNREGLMFEVSEPVESAVKVDCRIVEIKTSPVLVDHLDVEIEIKCTDMNKSETGKIADLKGEVVHCQIIPSQDELFKDNVEIKVELSAPVASTTAGQENLFPGGSAEEEKDDPTDRGLSNAVPKPTQKRTKKPTPQRPSHFQHVKKGDKAKRRK